MDTINRIRQFIKNTNAPCDERNDATLDEVLAIARSLRPVDAVAFAFEYGRAKEYAAAQAERSETA